MNITLSCDHRVLDGARGAAFMHDLVEALENPVL
jgi:pyruvate/2-oxoglutarate dehydrogenase complex dihydrolipoamide acyltransferase (E2) component